MDGGNALPDPKAERGGCENESERARLQIEAGDENHRYRRIVEGDDGVKASAFAAPIGTDRGDLLGKPPPRNTGLRHTECESVFTHSGPKAVVVRGRK